MPTASYDANGSAVGHPQANNILESASAVTLGIVDQLLDYMKSHRLRITDVFKMLDVSKAGRIRNAVLLTQRFYEFEIVQSLEEVKQFVHDLSTVSAANGSGGSPSNSQRRRGHAPSFSYDEFYKVLTFRRRHRLSKADGDRGSSSHAAAGRQHSPNHSEGQWGRRQKSATDGTVGASLAQQEADRRRSKKQILQQKIEEKRAAVNEQKAADLAQKVRDEEVRRQQLTRELAVLHLGEIEENLMKNATQQILSSVADSDNYFEHVEHNIHARFDQEIEIIRNTLDLEAAQVEAIGGGHARSSGGGGGAAGPGSSQAPPGQARQASISERRCAAVLRKLRDAKIELAETARAIEVARTHIERDNAARHRQGYKIRCVLACLQEVCLQGQRHDRVVFRS